MLEKVDLDKKMSKKEMKEILETESEKLALLQRKCKAAGIPIMVVFEGVGASGKGTQINRFIQPLDPRGFEVYSIQRENEEEKMRPFLWRFWTKTPANGRMAIFDRSWYRRVLTDRFDGITKESDIPLAFQDILSFEEQLSVGGTVIIKLFLYISKEEQKKRFKKLLDSKETAWRVTPEDLKRNKEYERYMQMNEEMLQKTDTDMAPWTIVEATDKEYAAVKIISCVAERLQYELDRREAEKGVEKNVVPSESSQFKLGALSGVDLSKSLEREEYKERLNKLQKKLSMLHNELYRLRIPVVLGFEGWDAEEREAQLNV